jgi:hypothetical protein
MIRRLLLSGLVVVVSLMMLPTTVAAATIIGETTQADNNEQKSLSAGRLRNSNSNSNSNNILNIVTTTTTTTTTNQDIENFVFEYNNEYNNNNNNNNNDDEEFLTCEDDKTYRYKNDPLKDCITWVSLKPNERCSKNSGVVFIFDDDNNNNNDNDDNDDNDDSDSDDEEEGENNKMEVTINFFCPSVCNSKCLDYENENESLLLLEEQEQEQEQQEQKRDLRSWSWSRREPPRYTTVNNRRPRPSIVVGGRNNCVDCIYNFNSGRANRFGGGIGNGRNKIVYVVQKPTTPWTGIYQNTIYVPRNNRPSFGGGGATGGGAGAGAFADTTQDASTAPPARIPLPGQDIRNTGSPTAPTTSRPTVSYIYIYIY